MKIFIRHENIFIREFKYTTTLKEKRLLRPKLLTILLDSEFEAVFADPKDLRTVNAAAKCLKASVSGPPPATANNCLSKSIDAWLFPEPLVPRRSILSSNFISFKTYDKAFSS